MWLHAWEVESMLLFILDKGCSYFKSYSWWKTLSSIWWAIWTFNIYNISSTSSPIGQMITCSNSWITNWYNLYDKLFYDPLEDRCMRMTKCAENVSDTLSCALCSTFLFLPHFDVICDLLLNRCITTGNSFVNFSN